MPRRTHILVVIAGVFVAHLVQVTLCAATYYICELTGLGHIEGLTGNTVLDHFYCSITTFTTVGIGDVHPRSSLRLIAGVESLWLVGVLDLFADGAVLGGRKHPSYHGFRWRHR